MKLGFASSNVAVSPTEKTAVVERRLMTVTGRPYRYEEFPGVLSSKNARLSIQAAMPFRFILEIEGAWQRVAKFLRFAGEFQTGDRMFDDRVYILSDSPQLAKKLHEDARLRQIVLEFFDQGVESLYSLGDRIYVDFRTRSRSMDEETTEDFVRVLDEINRRFSTVPEHTHYSTAPERHAKLFGLFTQALLLTGIIGAAIFLPQVNDMQRVAALGAGAAIPAIALTLLLVRWAVRKSAYGYKFGRALVLYGAPGMLLWGMALAARFSA